jgi:hypothetical protein
MEEMRNMYQILVRKHEWNKPLRRSRHRWKDDTKMIFKETRCGLVSSSSDYGPLMGCCEHGTEHLCSVKGMNLMR